MAGVLDFSQAPICRSFPDRRRTPRTSVFVRATSEAPLNSSSSSQTGIQEPIIFTAPPNFKPPEPKRFNVRPDKVLDIVGASLALLFRLGTGIFASGYVYFTEFCPLLVQYFQLWSRAVEFMLIFFNIIIEWSKRILACGVSISVILLTFLAQISAH